MGIFTDRFTLLKKADKPLYTAPQSVQQQIEILRIAKDGIFENTKNRYSRVYRFADINYVTVSEGDQYELLKQYCKLVNAIDVAFKITIYNKNKDMSQFRRNVLIPDKNDGFDHLRDVYNDIVEERIVAGKQGIEQERYLTVTVERKDYEQAKAHPDGKEDFHAVKKRAKRLIILTVGILTVTVAGVLAYKFMR